MTVVTGFRGYDWDMPTALAKLIGMNCAFFFVLVMFAANYEPWQWHSAAVGYNGWSVDVHMMERSAALRVREHIFAFAPMTNRFAWTPEQHQTQHTPNGPVYTQADGGFGVVNGGQFGSPWSGVPTWREWSVSAPYWFVLVVLAGPGGWWVWRMTGRKWLTRPKAVFQTSA